MLGGDSFVTTTDEAAGERGGTYKNDVWVSGGSGWEVYSDGSKPMAKSTMEWDEVNPGHVPPAGLTYEDWIICQVSEGSWPTRGPKTKAMPPVMVTVAESWCGCHRTRASS